jgi:UDPglucose--hexose-1-phosphate uridylyltransferase
VIIAENRAGRPNEFAAESRHRPVADNAAQLSCPFCPGQESRTPPAVYERHDDAGRWNLRVVPNQYPAVVPRPEESSAVANSPCATPALGQHEVIIESSRHVECLSALSVGELESVLAAYRQRLSDLRDAGQFRYALVFKNQGPRAGASIAHVHSQLIALPEVPVPVAAELRRAESHYREQNDCAYCQWLREEQQLGTRVVAARDGFVAFCPYASLQPFETWLLPAEHQPAYDQIGQSQLAQLASALHDLVVRIEPLVPEASFNLILRTAPWQAGLERLAHWRFELVPRVSSIAGWELATGIHINLLAPERAAERLRSQ